MSGIFQLLELAYKAGAAGVPLDEIFNFIKKEAGVATPEKTVVGVTDGK